VSPWNQTERVTAVIVYVLSLLLFALVIAVVTQHRLAINSDPFNVKMVEVANFSRFHRLPRGLRDKLSTFFESMYTNTSVVQDEELLAKMSPSLQDQVWAHILAATVKRIRLFTDLNVGTGGKAAAFFGETRGFQIGVYQALAYVTYSASDVILQKGAAANTLFFLRSGSVYATSADTKKTHLYSLSEVGQLFGESCLLEPAMTEQVDFVAQSRCGLFGLAKADLLQLVSDHLVPAHRIKLAKDVLKEIVRKAELHVTSLRSLISEASAINDEDRQLDIEDEIEPLEANLKELKAQTAQEAMPSLGGGEVEEEFDLDTSPPPKDASSLKIEAARIARSNTRKDRQMAATGNQAGGSTEGVESRVAELETTVKAMMELLQKVSASQQEIAAALKAK